MKYFLSVFLVVSIIFLGAFSVSCVYGCIYPLKYTEEIATASETFGVESSMIASVIRTESNFRADAVSSKGAVGLMQIMPSTAQFLADKLNYPNYDLKSPKDNIYLGTYYLSLLLNQYQDSTLALCAFNAGPGNVDRWLSLYSDDGKSLSNIPFRETRAYVERCARAKKYYQTKNKYFIVENK